MFTGIIQILGKVKACEPEKDFFYLSIETQKTLKGVKLGSSVAIQGICLTVFAIHKRIYSFHVLEETLKKTALHSLTPGQMVHLESSLKVGDEIGGHFVYGHGDGVGKVISCKPLTQVGKSDMLLTIQPPKKLWRFFVLQGSVALNGVSLTIAQMQKSTFTVCLVSFTVKNTLLANLKKSDEVNIECDMLAKYVQNKSIL